MAYKNLEKKKEWEDKNLDRRTEYKRKWHQENKERRLAAKKARRDKIYEWFDEYKSSLKCVKCGFDNPIALDFHHIDSKEKENSIATMVHDGCTKEKLIEEMQKCIVICSNCHRILHNTKEEV